MKCARALYPFIAFRVWKKNGNGSAFRNPMKLFTFQQFGICIMYWCQPNKANELSVRIKKTPILSSIWIMIESNFSILFIIVLKSEIFCRTCTSWISIPFYLSRMPSVFHFQIYLLLLFVSYFLFSFDCLLLDSRNVLKRPHVDAITKSRVLSFVYNSFILANHWENQK